MKEIEQSAKILNLDLVKSVEIMKSIEYAGRNCYASHDKITDDSYDPFIRSLIKRGHEAPVEMGFMQAQLVTSRAVLAEITRHRLASFCVESQRYINEVKTGDIEFIKPWWSDENPGGYMHWQLTMQIIENMYINMKEDGLTNEKARSILPNSTACKIVMSANLREWRHIFELRCAKPAYPEIRILMNQLLTQAKKLFPPVFEDMTMEE